MNQQMKEMIRVKTIYHPHKGETCTIKCAAWYIYTTHEGLACANCGELVQEDIIEDGGD